MTAKTAPEARPRRSPRLRSARYENRSGWQARERYEALRESAVAFFPKPYVRELKRILALQGSWFEEQAKRSPVFRGSPTKHVLRAAACDLRHLTSRLAEAASGAAESVSPSEVSMSPWVDDLAVEIARIAQKVERKLAPRRKGKEVASNA